MTIEYATRYRQASRIPAEPGKPYFIEKGEGNRAHLFGDLITIYGGGEQTENTFNFFTVEGPKGDPIPAHLPVLPGAPHLGLRLQQIGGLRRARHRRKAETAAPADLKGTAHDGASLHGTGWSGVVAVDGLGHARQVFQYG